MVSSWDEGKICHRSINACLCPLYAIEGMHVVTVEGNKLPPSVLWKCILFLLDMGTLSYDHPPWVWKSLFRTTMKCSHR